MTVEREAERQQSLLLVSRALSMFQRINELYFYAVNIDAQQTMARAMAIQNSKKKALSKQRGCTFFIALALIVIVLLCIPMSLSKNESLLVIPFFILVVFVGILRFLMGHRLRKSLKHIDGIAPEVDAAYTSDLEKISLVLTQIYEYNNELIEAIPRDYRNYDAVAYLESVLANGRAYSMQEALNLYEQYLHQQRLEANSRMALQQAERQSEMLAAIEYNSAQTARYSAITAANTAYFVIRDFLG